MNFRRTKGILSDTTNPKLDADVIMTAAVLGFAATQLVNTKHAIRFDIEDLHSNPTPSETKKWEEEWKMFKTVINRVHLAVNKYVIGNVNAGASPLTPDKSKGAVIMGVYGLAGQTRPVSFENPELSSAGQILFDKICREELPQYVGRGAYTGFVDNKNSDEGANKNPVGPKSTVRFLTPDPALPVEETRWMPSDDSPMWHERLKFGTTNEYIPWGMIGGDCACEQVSEKYSGEATNKGDQITEGMKDDGMVFKGEPDKTHIVGYTHGLPQAVYKAYGLGPSCTPYEITVGDHTTKLASCFPCTMFMTAAGYPPTSIHLGRGESWAPLYQAYLPDDETIENGVVRDLNNVWKIQCTEYLKKGAEILTLGDVIQNTHRPSLLGLQAYLNDYEDIASTLILDAITIHDKEINRLKRTLK